MGQLFLVRHAQASLGEDNYDQLSPLGMRQSLRLGEYWRELGLTFDTVLCGTLQRHAQTLEGIRRGLQQPLPTQKIAGLNEYDAEAVIHVVSPDPRPRPTTPEAYRIHFRLLREGLHQWMQGKAQPQGMVTWHEFVQGIQSALTQAHQSHAERVLVVSSGGPISVALGQIMGMSAEASIELNLQMRNTSVSELRTSANGFRVVSFNTLPHLAPAEFADWITYA